VISTIRFRHSFGSALALLLILGSCKKSSKEGQTAEKDVFDENVVTTYDIQIDPADWNAMVADPESDTWRRMSMTWEGETLTDVAVHPSGQHSRVPGNPKPSLHLSFEEFVPSRHFHHLPSLKLNSHIDDPALMRERMTYGVERSFGVAAPREVHARVVVNGEYKGLYGVEERITKKFVERWFPGSVRQIYKFSGAFADVWDRGDDPSQYVPLMFEAHVDSLSPDAVGMRDLITGISRGPYEQTAARFDLEVFLREIAVETVTGEEDAILAGPDSTNTVWTNNFYLYKAASTDKYTVIGWDRNEGYWRLPANASITEAFDRHILTQRLIMDRPENLARLKVLLRELLDGPGAVERLQARFDQIYAQIQPHMQVEPFNPKKPSSYQTWVFEAADLRNYLQLRHDGVNGQVP
jgi:spore coat protein CotH